MRIILPILAILVFIKCARQTQPNGGPKDTDPPQLLSSTPTNEEKNFHGNTIELTFDEYVKLKDPKEEIIITPSPGQNTKFLVKKTRVIITPEKKFSDSTTYSIAFREGIQDINEGNPTEDLHLAFSTGPTIDSLKILGSVSEVFKDQAPEKITIGLYQSDTFDIFQHKPPLFSKSDKNGKFAISNLKAGKYFIYAFDDKNKNQKVDSRSERFGFLAKEINLPQDKDTVQIQLVHLDTRKLRLSSIRNASTLSIIRFNKPVDSVHLTSTKIPIIYTYGDNKSEVVVYKYFDKADSLKINVFAKDSLEQKQDTSVYAKFTDNKIVEEKFKLSAWTTNYDLPTSQLKGEATCNKLLSSINFDSIYIQIDTANFQPINPKEISIDTLHKIIKLTTTLSINTKEKIPNPVLLFGKGAFVSIDNDSSKAQEIKIQIPKTETTGTVSVEIKTKEPHFEVRLMNSTGAIVKSFRDLKKFTFAYIPPAEYKISIVIDSNNNNRWDPGNFFKKQEPEKVVLYKTIDNKTSFPVRANWELGPLVITF